MGQSWLPCVCRTQGRVSWPSLEKPWAAENKPPAHSRPGSVSSGGGRGAAGPRGVPGELATPLFPCVPPKAWGQTRGGSASPLWAAAQPVVRDAAPGAKDTQPWFLDLVALG